MWCWLGKRELEMQKWCWLGKRELEMQNVRRELEMFLDLEEEVAVL